MKEREISSENGGDVREKERELMDGPDDSLSRADASVGCEAVDDPASGGSRQGRAVRLSITNFARLCECRTWGVLISIY